MGSISQPYRPQFVELDPALHTEAAGGPAWNDYDISAIIPQGTFAVEVAVCTGNQVLTVGARQNGSAIDTSFITVDSQNSAGAGYRFIVPVGSDRIIECLSNVAFAAYYSVIGYWI